MRILFLDQSGKLGGAELCLADIAEQYQQTSLVGVFDEGTFPAYLRQRNILVKILTAQPLQIQKSSGLLAGLKSLNRLLPLIAKVIRISKSYDLIYANTQKALVVGAIASFLGGRTLVYHLHDIVSSDHFSATNRHIIVNLANRFAKLIIANSEASKAAFIAAGGQSHKVRVVYNGFEINAYQISLVAAKSIRQSLNIQDKFVIGHFSRLSPWKGQHVLIEALTHCPDNVVALLVGDALFGEDDYVADLHQQIKTLNLSHRVHLLGFRTDVPELMQACDLIAHTSTAPEPFGRVIVEAMLCQRPIIASAAGGAVELIDNGETGWLCPPNAPDKLAALINQCQAQPDLTQRIVSKAYGMAQQEFAITTVNHKIDGILNAALQAT